MHPVKLALLRSLNLDLFAAPVAVAQPAPVSSAIEPDVDAPELLFPIGPDDQLDLFRDSPAETAATQVRRALKDRAVEQARNHLAVLRRLPAYAPWVADSDRCIELIERRDVRWSEAAIAMPWIEAELWPAAERCLHRDAMLLVRPALLAVLERSVHSPFDACNPHAHPSHIWLLLDQPEQAVAALERDPHWREQTAALIWHAKLCELAELHEHVAADIAELCLAEADAVETWLSESRSWTARWSAWCDLDDALPLHAFPAWCRLTRATQFPRPAASDPRRGAQLLRSADQLASNPNDVSLRKALHALSPELLAGFLESRAKRNP